MKQVAELVREHPFARTLDPAIQQQLGGCAANVVFAAGDYLTREGETATKFYLLRTGRVAVEMFVPARGRLTIQTAEAGDVVGISWMFGTSQWTFDSRATEPTRALALEVACLRAKCEADPAFGYALMKQLSHLLLERLQATRMRLLDLYA